MQKTTYNKKRSNKDERGVVLLIAVTISSLVLIIGIGILSIVTKETVLSSLSKNSQIAFFAADSGVECAMHWDLVNVVAIKRGIADPELVYPASIFATTSPSVANFNLGLVYGGTSALTDPKFNPFCAGQSAAYVFGAEGTYTDVNKYLSYYFHITQTAAWVDPVATTQFVFFPGGAPSVSAPCALVTITKQLDPATGRVDTEVLSEGFSSCNVNEARRVSRGVRVNYQI